jgi:hypothetical protein
MLRGRLRGAQTFSYCNATPTHTAVLASRFSRPEPMRLTSGERPDPSQLEKTSESEFQVKATGPSDA